MASDIVIETEALTRFVKASKRARCIAFASDARTRPKLLDELREPSLFDPRFVVEIPARERTPDKLVTKFRELGMSGRIYVMSSNADWDGQKFQMSWFVPEFHATGFDTLAFCWKSKTAFYEQHHSGFTYFLKK